jgi:membrane dipeptidase
VTSTVEQPAPARPAAHAPYPVSEAARSLHAHSIVADSHNDLLMLCAHRDPAEQAGYFRDVWLPQLRAGGVNVQVLPVFIDDEFRPEGALRQTLRMIETAWRVAEACPDAIRLCRTGDDIHAALADDTIAAVLALEGCEAVGTDVGLFDTLYRLGVRMASFTHLGRTMLADGSAEDATGGRLTSAGVAAVAACEALGIVLDVSHLGAAGTDHLLELATRPVVASHSSAFAVRPHHRNLTDDRLRAIAEGGGVIGINLLAMFIDEDEHTVARAVDHIEHAVSVAGAAHVGLGPDFIRAVSDGLARADDVACEGHVSRQYIAGLEGPAGLPLITEELLRRGWPDTQVQQVLGLNFHRLLVDQLGVPGGAAR